MTTKPTETFVPIPKGTYENIKVMAFVSQLHKLYRVNKIDGKINYVAGLCGPYFMFDELYDFLTEKGFKIEFQVMDGSTQEDVKKELWKMAKTSAAIQKLKNQLTEKRHKELEIKLYKSELLYLCLVQLWNIKGKELSFDNEDGSKRHPMIPLKNIEMNNDIIKYLELKASELV